MKVIEDYLGDGVYACRGTGVVRRLNAQDNGGETAVSGRFTMRPIRTELIGQEHDQ